MNYIRGLDDQDKPDYKHFRSLFSRLFRRKGFEHDNVFDRTVREFEKPSNVNQQRLFANDVDSRGQRGRTSRRERKRTRQNRGECKMKSQGSLFLQTSGSKV